MYPTISHPNPTITRQRNLLQAVYTDSVCMPATRHNLRRRLSFSTLGTLDGDCAPVENAPTTGVHGRIFNADVSADSTGIRILRRSHRSREKLGVSSVS